MADVLPVVDLASLTVWQESELKAPADGEGTPYNAHNASTTNLRGSESPLGPLSSENDESLIAAAAESPPTPKKKEPTHTTSPFPVNEALNRKLCLW